MFFLGTTSFGSIIYNLVEILNNNLNENHLIKFCPNLETDITNPENFKCVINQLNKVVSDSRLKDIVRTTNFLYIGVLTAYFYETKNINQKIEDFNNIYLEYSNIPSENWIRTNSQCSFSELLKSTKTIIFETTDDNFPCSFFLLGSKFVLSCVIIQIGSGNSYTFYTFKDGLYYYYSCVHNEIFSKKILSDLFKYKTKTTLIYQLI